VARATRSWTARCERCGQDPDDRFFDRCARCGGVIELDFDLEPVRTAGRAWLRGRSHSIWGYAELLPQATKSEPVTLGEGDTPLLLSSEHKRRHDRRVFWKNEAVNPTWSHKDRFQSVAATMARDLGYRGLTGSSTGNHGIAAAAYAAASGLRSLIFYPPEMSTAFLHLTGLYGGQAAVAGWSTRPLLVDRVLERPGWCPVDDRNPFGPEGYKTIAYELVRDLDGAPDLCFVPVGSGRLIVGVWKGFMDLHAAGLIDSAPRMVACQAAGVGVVSRALRDGAEEIGFDPDVQTVALSTRESTSDRRVLGLLRESGGTAVSVPEGRIADGIRRYAVEGHAGEPASVLPKLAFEILCEKGDVPRSSVSVCLMTSSLVKTPELLGELSPRRPWRFGRDLAELDQLLDAQETDHAWT
jgi:threonine synthase